MSESDDDWDTAGDRDDLVTSLDSSSVPEAAVEDAAIGEAVVEDADDWNVPVPAVAAPAAAKPVAEGNPMLIVNLTVLSGGEVHNKNDKNSNNDPVLVSEWKKKIEGNYAR